MVYLAYSGDQFMGVATRREDGTTRLTREDVHGRLLYAPDELWSWASAMWRMKHLWKATALRSGSETIRI